MNKNCLICGVGGQGVVLASRLIASAAMDNGLFVRTAETIGMAQRGGSVVSHVRWGDDIHSPLIPFGEADLILALEPAEAVRALHYLKEGGVVVTSSKAIRPVTATLAGGYNGGDMLDYLKSHVETLHIVDTDAICTEAGSLKAANIALLGAAAASGALSFSLEQIEAAIHSQTREKFFATNQKALRLGAAVIGGI
jgi:indolepyruvate ferredoxin oxidoreductase beta subunit